MKREAELANQSAIFDDYPETPNPLNNTMPDRKRAVSDPNKDRRTPSLEKAK